MIVRFPDSLPTIKRITSNWTKIISNPDLCKIELFVEQTNPMNYHKLNCHKLAIHFHFFADNNISIAKCLETNLLNIRKKCDVDQTLVIFHK